MEAIVFYGIVLITFVMLFFQGYYLDKVSNNGIYYGVRVPEGEKDIEEISIIRKDYRKRFLIVMLPSIFFAFISIYYTKRVSLFLIAIFILGFLQESVYYFTWKKMKNLKREKGWTAQSRNVVIVDIRGKKDKKEKGPIPDKAFLFLGVFAIITFIITIVMYDKLPDTFPIHYNIAGEADGFAQKGSSSGYVNILMLPIMQIFMVGMFYYTNKYGLLYRKLINSGSIKGVAEKQRLFRRYMSMYLFIIGAEIIFLFSIMQISMFYPQIMKFISPIAFAIIMISSFGGIIALLVIGQGGRNLKVKDEGEVIYRDDDDLYFLGEFYYNKEDPCIIIQKRMGIGTDFNYANRIAQIIIASVAILVIAVVIFLIFNEPILPF